MTSRELNLKILEYFPKLKNAYEDEVSWQEGDETGSHVVYGDVFVPHFEQNLNARNIEGLTYMFKFLEDLLAMEDDYAENVIAVNVIEGNEDKLIDSEIHKLLGPRTKKVLWDMINAEIPR